ncbi:MAG: hemolysin III family protein [Kiritimatiellae bacterium]|nr:hemolysin III family protein [Kiritimatiellia bacterium]
MINHEQDGFSAAEEIAHSVTHAIGSHLGAAMLALLLVFAAQSQEQCVWKVVSAAVYGSSIILLYGVSTIYHALVHPRAKRVLEICDHMAIYFLIAGSYTPIVLVALRPNYPALSWTMFGIVWSMALAGVVMKLFTTGRYRIVSTLAYIVMGWVAVIGIVPLYRTMDPYGLMWLVLGGALYTLGTVFYIWRVMPFHHAIWHVFVLAGTLCHFFCILFYVII